MTEDYHRDEGPKLVCHQCGKGDALEPVDHPKARYYCTTCDAVTTGSPLAALNHQARKAALEAEQSAAHQAFVRAREDDQ